MTEGTVITRRRAITIIAGGVGAFFAGPAQAAPIFEWRGTALGADARIILAHPDRHFANSALAAVCQEIERLENIFSLYRQNSALSQLNRAGTLTPAPLELIDLTRRALWFTTITNGAFDITVQSLWALYAKHFQAHPNDTTGPSRASIDAVRRCIGPDCIRIDPPSLHLAPGTHLTFNGIAQGYITDRAANLLRQRGWNNVLINLGETRALGAHPDGRPWRINLPNGGEAKIKETAIATSNSVGTRFTDNAPQHHLFDPQTGQSATERGAVTIAAPDAVDADALSTALFVMPPNIRQQVLLHVPGSRLING
tara:strand:+ start:8276 stop:9211 length:936 start_codon:yes stop_codon:yes gene_type:complete